LVRSFNQIDIPTTVLSLSCLAVLLVAPRISKLKRIPAPLIALVLATAFVALVRPTSVETIGTQFGGIPTGLPRFAPPAISWDRITELLLPAFTIAMLGAIESLLSAVVADGMAGTKHDSNQELMGQGFANLATSVLGGFAATGAIARTATNIRNGGNSPISGVTHSVVLIGILLALAPLASNIPLSVLAAILFIVAWNMSDVRHVVSMTRKAPIADVAILWITLLLTVFMDLVVAVNVGVILATLLFLKRMADSVEVGQEKISPESDLAGLHIPPDTLVFAIDGPFFFAAVESFERALAETHTDPKTVILRLGRVPFMDGSAIEALDEAIRDLQGRGVTVILTEVNSRSPNELEKAGSIERVGPGGMAATLGEALALADSTTSR
ncbi:MAG: SulP family inorganic anion transporter, partial [Chloroflexota bacterium]